MFNLEDLKQDIEECEETIKSAPTAPGDSGKFGFQMFMKLIELKLLYNEMAMKQGKLPHCQDCDDPDCRS